MNKLAIITTHPIQYYAPVFKYFTESGIQCKVFYTWGEGGIKKKYDPSFGKTIEWDIPLLEGYQYEFCKNVSKEPGSHHYKGIDNPKLIDAIKAYGATHLLIFGWNFKSHLKVMRYFKGKLPILFRGDSTLLNHTNQPFYKILARKWFLSWVYKHIDCALYVGKENKKYYTFSGLKEKQLVFAPHAIDNHRFSNNLENKKQAAEQWKIELGIDLDKIVVLYAGKFEAVKNVELLVKAFKLVNSEKLQLLLVGNGILEQSLKALADGKTNICFLPFQNQSKIPLVYMMSDIYVLPSKSETWGLAVNEAMACGRAVLVSNKCGCATDLVNNGVNGYVFESNDLQSLTDKLHLLLANKHQLVEMGKASYQMIQDWSFDAIVDGVEKGLGKVS